MEFLESMINDIAKGPMNVNTCFRSQEKKKRGSKPSSLYQKMTSNLT